MTKSSGTKAQLIAEISALKRKIQKLEKFSTGRKQVDEALKASEENFRRSLDESPLGVRIVTAAGETIYANRAILDIYGYDSIEELKANPVKKRYTPESFAEFQIRREKRKRDEYNSSEYEVSIIRKDDKVRHLHVHRKEIIWNGKRQNQVVYQDIAVRKQLEETLQKYDKLFHGNPAAMAVSSIPERRFTDVNNAFVKVVGYSREEVIGKTSKELDIFIESEKQQVIADELRASGHIANHELKIKSKDGNIIDGIFSGEIIESQGKTYFLTVMIDQTERKKAEEKFRLITENMVDCVALVDASGNYQYATPSYRDILGYDPGEMIGFNGFSLIEPDDRERIFKLYMKSFEKGLREMSYETRLCHKDGHYVPIEIRVRALNDAHGNIIGGVLNARDISKRLQLEQERQEVESQRAVALNALMLTEERYRSLVENASDIIFRTDNTGHFTFINRAALSITGYKEEEVIGMHYPALIRPDMRDEAIKLFGRQFVKGIKNTYSEFPVIAKDGHHLWFGQNTQLIVEDGNITGFQSVARDITERKLAQKALHDAEESYRNIFINSQIGLFRTDIKTGLVLEANDSMAKFAGYKNREELLSSNFNIAERYTDPEARLKMLAIIKEHGQIDNYETPFRRNDGSIIWIRLSAKIVPAKGCLEGVAEDITKEKDAREALLKSEERYRSLVENAHESIVVIQDGVIKFVNGKAVESFGYSQQELLNINVFDLIHPEDRDLVLQRYLQKINGDKTASRHIYRTVHKSGQTPWIEISSVLIDWEGRPATLNLITDITERMQAEEEKKLLEDRLQQADKMEAIGTLAGGIAHDFNNLLMGMQGYASMTLMNLSQNDPNYERLKRIEEQVRSGADLTSQLLGFARGGRYEVKTANMNEIIEKSSSMFGRTKKEITIHRKSEKDLWGVEIDRGQMEQVFLNLFVNAWQAMPGGGDIYLETQNDLLNGEQALFYSLKPGKYVKITVTDTGTGMDVKTKERIFEPFFTTKGMGRGTGLGLASVYGIIKGHEGMITVYSEPDQGTTFTIYLPASEKQIPREETPTDEIVMGTETILLIDDEKIVMEVNKELLESMGYKLYVASSGQEGLDIYMEKKDKIDLIILDMIMPGMSGSDTFDRLREINPNAKVLLSSGYSLTDKALAIMDRGCNGFLQKPFRLEELSGKVREMLGEGKTEGE